MKKWYATVIRIDVDAFVYYLCDDPETIAATQRNTAAGPSVSTHRLLFAMSNADFSDLCDWA